MSEYKIFSDGACDLTIDEIKRLGIETIPFYVSFDGQNYKKEIYEIGLPEFYDKLINEDDFPKTSLPSVNDYIDAFVPYLKKGMDIICLTITTTLSGSFQSAQNACSILQETYKNNKICIIDSRCATGSQALLLNQLSLMQKAGITFDKIVENISSLINSARIFFMVGSLKHLEKGGRIGKLAVISGKILNIKPLIELKNGAIDLIGICQSRKKGLLKLINNTKEHFIKTNENPNDYVFTFGNTNTPEESAFLKENLLSVFPNIDIYEWSQIGATISAHTGPFTTGICFIKKFDKILNKS